MANYFDSLDSTAKRRYIERLTILGLTEKDDPYTNQDKFVDNMTMWPPVEYGHIWLYFIKRLGVYTEEELLQWKSMKAYNYFQSGFVQEVKVWTINTRVRVLYARVNLSMRSPDKAHECWVAVQSSGISR